MSLYNIDFDVCAIVVYIVVSISYLQKKHVNKGQHYIFMCFLLTSILTPILDIPSAIVIENHADRLWVEFFNCGYYLVRELSSFMFMLYVLSNIEFRKNISGLYKLFIVIPVTFIVVMIILNPVTGWIFSYSGRVFSGGPLRLGIYSVSLFYVVWTFISVIRYRNILNVHFKTLVYIICALNIILEVVQFHKTSLLIHSLAGSITMLLFLVNIERYGMVVDSNTGMAKKEHLSSTLKKMLYTKMPFGVILIHINEYEVASSTYGVENVQNVIQSVQRYLVTESEEGKAFEISKKTFALVYTRPEDLNKIAEKIYQHIKKPIKYNNTEYLLQYEIASFQCPEQISILENINSFIIQIDMIESMAPGILKFEDVHYKDKERERKVENAIKNALRNGGFEVFYQPICTAKEQDFVTAEALLRLTDPEMGKIGPDEFIPIAESSGLIMDVGYFVIDSVCSFIEKHDLTELGLKYIEVNLSTIQCLQQNFMEVIDEVTYRHKIKPENICFEITETASSSAPEIFNRNLKMLNERGYALALDDFGTGYGNLQRMISSDFKIIKFDKNLTQQFSGEEILQKMYKSLQIMIATMGSEVVSEGVETKEQYEFVRDAGAGYIQGYYFSKPLPAEEFCRFLKERKKL